MSRGGGALRAVLAGLVAALDRSVRTKGAAGARRGDRVGPDGRGSRRGFSKAGYAPDPDGSPGQFGSAATRDLTAAELHALRPEYAPRLDGEPDPGEVVWTWVPYVENDGRGKDRPVLIIARLDDGRAWAACYLSTKPHRGFVSIGSGPWDSKGRESFLSPERVLRVTENGMRRESTGVSRTVFERAVASIARHHRLG